MNSHRDSRKCTTVINIAYFRNVLLANVSKYIYVAIMWRTARKIVGMSFAHRRVVIYVPGFGLKQSGGEAIAFFGNVYLEKVAKHMYLAVMWRTAKKIVDMSFAHRRVVIYVPGFGFKQSGGGNRAFFGNVLLAKVAKHMYLAFMWRTAKKIVHMSFAHRRVWFTSPGLVLKRSGVGT